MSRFGLRASDVARNLHSKKKKLKIAPIMRGKKEPLIMRAILHINAFLNLCRKIDVFISKVRKQLCALLKVFKILCSAKKNVQI